MEVINKGKKTERDEEAVPESLEISSGLSHRRVQGLAEGKPAP